MNTTIFRIVVNTHSRCLSYARISLPSAVVQQQRCGHKSFTLEVISIRVDTKRIQCLLNTTPIDDKQNISLAQRNTCRIILWLYNTLKRLRKVCCNLKEIYIRLYGRRQSLTRQGFIEHSAN